jgi:uncharacterized protein
MTDSPARPVLDWSGKAPFPFTRESSIKLDRDGHFFHDGVRVDHPGLARAMATWITRHPDNGRWVLENGYDWCYIAVEDVPLWVKSARVEGSHIIGTLSDGTDETIDAQSLAVDDEGTIRCEVKASARKGPYPAKLARHAQLALSERLRERDGQIALALDGGEVILRRV